ncbi:GNAT family N-acetyltransferase [Desulfosporosinus sp. OT]|uniref:GNAT family N-acetyltransferase n=1 Tax=Desulfosporosinus sp. OT TaxID=913865 RepID=UPI000223A7FA|nr:GNAT family N-acetyltransferase [Desulfosporosinus sp. OT]EGW37063.1 acetyltransferase family protein [Desulfosporosinus sp. OT]
MGRFLLFVRRKKNDALVVLEYINKVSTESDNLTFGECEFGITEDEEVGIIETITKSDNQLMLCAFIDDKLVGQLVFRGGSRLRIRHAGEFGITVLQAHWGKGIGSEMINYLIAWAKETQIIRKINLRVRSDNQQAISLYRKFGFVSEGTITREFLINGEFYDSIHMGLEID